MLLESHRSIRRVNKANRITLAKADSEIDLGYRSCLYGLRLAIVLAVRNSIQLGL